jgi:HEAT repeat protein
MAAFRQGRDLIADERWPMAVQVFSDFIKDYPSDKNVDAALYWLAFSLKKERRFTVADMTLKQLIRNFPKSKWVNDARAMRAEIAPQLGSQGAKIVQDSTQSGNDEVKILALQSLMTLDVQRGSEMATNILKPTSGASARLKGAALSLLGRYGGKGALPVLSGMARDESDLSLRKRAISALGSSDDESVLDTLRDQVLRSTDASITSIALSAIAENSSPRAVAVLGELAQNAQLSLHGRKTAIAYISGRRGEPAVDELFKIYDSNPPVEIRRQIISGLAVRKSPRAQERLIQIAKTGETPELRIAAISSLVRRGTEGPVPVLDVLLQLYDSEKSEEVKGRILETFANSKDKRAQAKLMEAARNTSTPVELRKKAVVALGRSKDPEVLKFLEDLLK